MVAKSNVSFFLHNHLVTFGFNIIILDLILRAVYPFTSGDYHCYRSAGFRGQLGKGFHTVNGLTHVFVHGVPLDIVSDDAE